MPTHAVIWIDHKEARVFHVHPEATEATTVLAPQHHLHRHPKGRGEDSSGTCTSTTVHWKQRSSASNQRIIPPMERSSPARRATSWRAIE
jgi:hypothetical protein